MPNFNFWKGDWEPKFGIFPILPEKGKTILEFNQHDEQPVWVRLTRWWFIFTKRLRDKFGRLIAIKKFSTIRIGILTELACFMFLLKIEEMISRHTIILIRIA